MKKTPLIIFSLIIACIVCFGVLFPSAVSGSDKGPDTIVGARVSMPYADTRSFDIMVSGHDGGSVRPRSSDSPAGESVFFSVSPESGFDIASVAVISSSGNMLELTGTEGGYSFKMPAEAVVIDVTFQYARQ